MLNSFFSSSIPFVLFFVSLFIYIKIAGPIPFSVNSINTNKTDVFLVSGEGKATTKPDVALVNIDISATGTTVKQVQEQINSVTSQVASKVKNLGVEENDIQTTNYNIQPSYDYKENSPKITGFTASSTLQIKVHEIDKINNVIDESTSAGANQIGSISFDVSDKTKVEDEARTKAVAQARKKAEEAAKIAGFELGKIINYSENFGGSPRPIPLQMSAATLDEKSLQTKVEPGSSEIIVNVTLSYSIR